MTDRPAINAVKSCCI